MSNQYNDGLPCSYGNGFPQSSGDGLPFSSQCENDFHSLGNGRTRYRLSSTLLPLLPVILPTSSFTQLKDMKLLKPFWHVDMKMEIMCVRTL